MAEYIEREGLLKWMKEEKPKFYIEHGYLHGITVGFDYALKFVKQIPSADVVEVVRCKDCEYYEIGKNYTPYCNNVLNMFEEMKPDDFCSYGERRTTE